MEHFSPFVVGGATLRAARHPIPAPTYLLPQPVEPPASPCRFCGEPLDYTFVDLGTSPLCQHHVRPHEFNRAEACYPLHARVCRSCFLVQLDEFVTSEEIFQNDYAYFSSYSASWLRHARRYTDMATERFGLTSSSLVVEVASNDGYLLQYFVEKNIPVLGIEPAGNVASYAQAKGINTLVRFFGTETARYVAQLLGQADVLLGNNVLAHVPDINDFVAGLGLLLKPDGVVTMEFPHLLRLMEGNQFDTIYHEHFSYLSFYTVERIFAHHGLTLFDVEELPTHGGSLRIFARHSASAAWPVTERVGTLRRRELAAGITDLAYYSDFEEKAKETKRKLLEFLIEAKREGKTVVGYGAPGKGNTLLNYCGIRTDFLDYTVDVSPHKQGNFLPGTRIPICHPDRIRQTQPDYVLILPWNLQEEIMEQMQDIRAWGGRFVVPIPEVQVYA
ncbi:class I SAM-dependent methyltransferase [Hymenobacter sp. HSC-4F20]|uniref:class I SAM-dependent methyltransferase n=1 Tax=Hymenobacter sp. HSC-4F20 TaxID=2864135 RepID=UPI001C72B1DD|nr:class I SAM-dependent methyltransferase [Hymenobacter sp. HSC-4F20]MBX0290438.1 class I SAM-dependent methyltransferase [Hymenobacter sp. HSC-4F20]